MAVTLSSLAGAGAQFFDNNGVPLAGGLIYTYLAGTNTPAATYTSSTGLIAHSNPIVLDAAGRIATGEVWLTSGVDYKFLVKTSVGVQLGSYDNIPSINDFTLIYAALANTTDPTLGDALVGFRQSNSSGNLSGAVGKTVHQKLQESVSVKDFGAVGDGTTDDTAAIVAALVAVNSILFPPGTYKITANITVGAGKSLTFDSGAMITATSAFNLVLNNTSVLIADRYKIFSGSASVTNLRVAYPEWWGATNSTTVTCNTEMQAALDALKTNGSLLLNNSFYSLNGATPLLIDDGQSINGQGTYQSTLYVITAAVNAIKITTTAGAQLRNFRIFCNTVPTSGNAIFVEQSIGDQVGRILIENIALQTVFNGILLQGNSTSALNNCFLSNIFIRVVVNNAIRYDNCEGMLTSRAYIDAAGGINSQTGAAQGGIIMFNRCQAVDFFECNVSNCQTAGLITSNTGGVLSRGIDVRWNSFNTCYFDDCEYGMDLNVCSDMRFVNCWASSNGRSFRGFAGDGVLIRDQTQAISFIGGTFSNNGQRGFRILNGANGVTIKDAQVVGNSVNDTTVNPFWAIDVFANTLNFAITGCIVRGTDFGWTDGDSRGIQVRLGSSDNYIITNNQISNVFNNDYLNDAGTGVNKIVTGNLTWV